MGSIAFAYSGVYFQPRSLEDFLFNRRPKSDQKCNKSLLKDHGDDYHTYEERCINSDNDNLIASALHGGGDEEIMKDLADLEINERSDDDRLFQGFCNK